MEDFCNGVQDLREKLIETPLDPVKTFSEDPLRMLRAIRFQVKLNFRLSERVSETLQRPEICSRLSIVARSRFQ